MCVSLQRQDLFNRAGFFGVMSAVGAPFVLGTGAVAEAADVDRTPLPQPPMALARGNARAVRLAQRSPLVHATYARIEELARGIGDERLRSSILAFLRDPNPTYARRSPTAAARTAIRDELARAGFVKPDAPVAGIFPPGTEPDVAIGVQPFWSTPGSGEGSHHGYPGGLGVHEYFNASMATSFADTYDRHYFDGRKTIERDTVVGAALYHDIMKAVVFQWHDDGTIFDELEIAGTGGHHVLSGAEAIVHGRSARFVTTLLSAHAAPSLGDETHVVDWCRAAAIVAGVDPVSFGLLVRDGTAYKLAASPPALETFISFLSDHDWALSVHAAHVVQEQLKKRYAARPAETTFGWYRAALLARTTAISLYDTLSRRGEGAFNVAVGRAESTLDLAGL
jgi:hypothetical protein